MEGLKYIVALHHLPLIGQRRLTELITYFHSPAEAWHNYGYWGAFRCFHNVDLEQILDKRKTFDVDGFFEKMLQHDIRLVTQPDPTYPTLLKNIFDPPYILYYKGELPEEDDICVGMVGSRRATAYGRQIAETIAAELGRTGIWVVSGMARGIDTCCHRGCLKGKGKTIAVLGSGLDVIYPSENKSLFSEIVTSGAVITDFPLGTQPLPSHFPARNRIISGLSRGVVVVEAAEKSGSLITVEFALEQGRDVFAVPGPVTSLYSRGTHPLIKEGAKLVETAADIIEEYLQIDISEREKRNLFSFSATERELLELMSIGQVHFDVLLKHSGLAASVLASLLTIWEVKGYIRQLPGKHYIIGNV